MKLTTSVDDRSREKKPDRPSDPFFVVAVQRSGSTMLRFMLNSHPELAVPFESSFIPRFYRNLDDYGSLEEAENRRRLVRDIAADEWVRRGRLIEDPDAIRSDRASTYSDIVDEIFRAYARRQGKSRWGDKTPGYISDIDLLRQLFPSSKIIHLVRDGRDVSLSLGRVDWGSDHLLRNAEKWRWQNTLAHKMGALLGDDYLCVRFEDLVREPESSLRRICDFLGEPYRTEMLEYPETARQELPDRSLRWHQTSVQPPDPSKAFEWKRKMSVSDRYAFDRVAGDALELFGYDVDVDSGNFLGRLKTLYYTLVRRW